MLLLCSVLACTPASTPAASIDEPSSPSQSAAQEAASPTAEDRRYESSPLAIEPSASFVATAILGRPTHHSVTVNAVPREDIEVFFEWGTEPGVFSNAMPPQMFAAGTPAEMTIDHLSADTDYVYRMRYRRPGEDSFAASDEHRFHTWRPEGCPFTFDIQADSHLDEGVDPAIYIQSLQNILEDRPDFLLDLGDTFMSGKLAQDQEEVIGRHLLQRDYFGYACHSVPLFLTLGNHEGELGWLLDGTPENIAVWATKARQRYYPNPVPDDFYSGDTATYEHVGLRESSYAWEWGNALFIVLDPYWHTVSKPKNPKEGWNWTLGKQQYSWMTDVLHQSDATFKLVFIHHLTGGANSIARGGVEVAPYFEWGGLNADGTPGFAENRPGWAQPIHDLLIETDVSAVFHGHDHLFAYQQLDGIVYQEVPQPGHPATGKGTPGAEHGYVQGTMLSSPGHLRVAVTPEALTVEYVRAALRDYADNQSANGEVLFAYEIVAPRQVA